MRGGRPSARSATRSHARDDARRRRRVRHGRRAIGSPMTAKHGLRLRAPGHLAPEPRSFCASISPTSRPIAQPLGRHRAPAHPRRAHCAFHLAARCSPTYPGRRTDLAGLLPWAVAYIGPRAGTAPTARASNSLLECLVFARRAVTSPRRSPPSRRPPWPLGRQPRGRR